MAENKRKLPTHRQPGAHVGDSSGSSHPENNTQPSDYWGEYSANLKATGRGQQHPVGNMEGPVKKSDSPKQPEYDTNDPVDPGSLDTEPYRGPIKLYRGGNPLEHDN